LHHRRTLCGCGYDAIMFATPNPYNYNSDQIILSANELGFLGFSS